MRIVKAGGKAVAFDLVSDRVFQLGENKLNARLAQFVVQINQHICRSDVDTGHRLGRHHEPAYRGGTVIDLGQYLLVELFGIGEEQGRIPTEDQQARYKPRIRVTLEIVVALYPFSPREHCIMRTPAIADELQQCGNDGQ